MLFSNQWRSNGGTAEKDVSFRGSNLKAKPAQTYCSSGFTEVMGVDGFEPPKRNATDLQSVRNRH